jgi:hypothetical protein
MVDLVFLLCNQPLNKIIKSRESLVYKVTLVIPTLRMRTALSYHMSQELGKALYSVGTRSLVFHMFSGKN